MKVLRIRLRNLASLAGTHCIDFTAEPLASTGLFAISGPTGSGKSTVLDALCLALFEDTPRLSQARGNPVPDPGGEVQPKDPATLLRRGATEGFAEVAFIGVDSITYTARWHVRRARLRPEGSLQRPEMALYLGNVLDGAGGTLLQGGRKTEVLAAIQQKVGLDFDQFTRAVLLAQNDFAAFLKADDRDRALILQALTGSQRFERLSIAAFNRDRAERLDIQELSLRLQGQAPLPPHERELAEQTRATARLTLATCRQDLSRAEADLDWFHEHRRLLAQLADSRTRHDEAERARTEAAPRRARLEHTAEVLRGAGPLRAAFHGHLQHLQQSRSLADQATLAATRLAQELDTANTNTNTARIRLDAARLSRSDAEPALQQARLLDAGIQSAATRLAETSAEATQANARLTQASDELATLGTQAQGLDASIRQLQHSLQPFTHLLPFAPEVAAWQVRIRTALDAGAQLANAQGHLTRTEQDALSLSSRLRELEPRLEAARTSFNQARVARESAEAQLATTDPGTLTRLRTQLESEERRLTLATGHLATAVTIAGQLPSLQEAIRTRQHVLQEDSAHLERLLHSDIPAAEAAWKSLANALTNAVAATEHAAVSLRRTLLPQHPCPVCGSLDHPFDSQPPTPSPALDSLREDEQRHRLVLESHRTRAAALQQVLPTHRQDLTRLQSQVQDLLASQATSLQHARSHPGLAQLDDSSPAALLDHAKAIGSQLEQERARLTHAEQQWQGSRAAADQALRHSEQARNSLDDLITSHARLNQEHAAATATVQAARSSAEVATLALDRARHALTPLEAALPETDRPGFSANLTEVLPPLLARLEAVAREQAQLAAHQTSLLSITARQQAAQRTHDLLAAQAAQANKLQLDARQHLESLQSERGHLLQGRPADLHQRDLDQAVQEADAALTQALAHAGNKAQAAAAAEAARIAAIRTRDDISTRVDAARDELDSWVQAFAQRQALALDRIPLEEMFARDEAWLASERATLDGFDNRVATLQGELTTRSRALDEHLARRTGKDPEDALEPEVVRLRASLAEAEARHLAAETTLAADDQRRAAAADLVTRLEQRQRQAEPWAQLSELIGSSDGARFRAIAQRHTLDLLLRDANAQLDLLAPRYRLERLPESLNLVVVDRDLGDERRTVHSLSGGESFLISLALALGLASLTSSRLRIESLFIDEGFGSLDPETLNIAMGALMHLEAQGRKVGVISHVSEMADAIPVQIRVLRARNGASRILVPGAPQPGVPIA